MWEGKPFRSTIQLGPPTITATRRSARSARPATGLQKKTSSPDRCDQEKAWVSALQFPSDFTGKPAGGDMWDGDSARQTSARSSALESLDPVAIRIDLLNVTGLPLERSKNEQNLQPKTSVNVLRNKAKKEKSLREVDKLSSFV